MCVCMPETPVIATLTLQYILKLDRVSPPTSFFFSPDVFDYSEFP